MSNAYAMTIIPIWKCWIVLDHKRIWHQSQIQSNVNLAIFQFDRISIENRFNFLLSFLSIRFTMLWSFNIAVMPIDVQEYIGNWRKYPGNYGYIGKRWLRSTNATWTIMAMLFVGQSQSHWSIVDRNRIDIENQSARYGFSQIALLSQSSFTEMPSFVHANILKWLDGHPRWFRIRLLWQNQWNQFENMPGWSWRAMRIGLRWSIVLFEFQ